VLLTERPTAAGSWRPGAHQCRTRRRGARATRQALMRQSQASTSRRTVDWAQSALRHGGKSGEQVVPLQSWPESIFAFTPVWTRCQAVRGTGRSTFPGSGRSQARDDLFAPQKMGESS